MEINVGDRVTAFCVKLSVFYLFGKTILVYVKMLGWDGISDIVQILTENFTRIGEIRQ